MTMFAPERPTTEQLHAAHASNVSAELINHKRLQTSQILDKTINGLISIVGCCSLTCELELMLSESAQLQQLETTHSGSLTLQRRNFWKPRSLPDDWHGPETTDPTETFKKLAIGARLHANGAAEIANLGHLKRYGSLLTFAWIGARNTELETKKAIALTEPNLPLGIKNPLSGNIDQTVETVGLLNRMRGHTAAPVVLIYRGGNNAQTPELWEREVIHALELTEGKMILDLAHGGEMAHDPSGNFTKSISGQEQCAAHAIAMAASGNIACAYLMEASETASLTDPNMSFVTALEIIKQLIGTELTTISKV